MRSRDPLVAPACAEDDPPGHACRSSRHLSQSARAPRAMPRAAASNTTGVRAARARSRRRPGPGRRSPLSRSRRIAPRAPRPDTGRSSSLIDRLPSGARTARRPHRRRCARSEAGSGRSPTDADAAPRRPRAACTRRTARGSPPAPTLRGRARSTRPAGEREAASRADGTRTRGPRMRTRRRTAASHRPLTSATPHRARSRRTSRRWPGRGRSRDPRAALRAWTDSTERLLEPLPERALEGGAVGRPAVRGEYVLDRALEQWSQLAENLLGGPLRREPVSRELESLAQLDQCVAGHDRPSALDPEHDLVLPAPRKHLDATGQTIARRVHTCITFLEQPGDVRGDLDGARDVHLRAERLDELAGISLVPRARQHDHSLTAAGELDDCARRRKRIEEEQEPAVVDRVGRNQLIPLLARRPVGMRRLPVPDPWP